jgi:hypothetical protein
MPPLCYTCTTQVVPGTTVKALVEQAPLEYHSEQDGRDRVKAVRRWHQQITVPGAYSVSCPYSTCSNSCGGSLDHPCLRKRYTTRK